MSSAQPQTVSPTAKKYANVLGVKVSAINIPMALDTIERWIRTGEQHYVTITGVHGVIESQSDANLLEIHNRAGMVTPDGMPLVWMNHVQGNKHVSRVYGPDLMLAVCEASKEKGYKHFFYGGMDGVPELLKEKLTARFPHLQVVGMYSPPFRALTPEEDAAICQQIDDSGADIVWVGLSTPKQERWMSSHIGKFKAPVMVGVGAAFDFHAGLKKQAPKWMQKRGLEWFFRLVSEPRRLGKRYLINNPKFIGLVALQMLGVRRKPLPDYVSAE
ncbi:MAG TPA: WecB/TagA/CpsF family glycosyltransferase [Aggregatilineales bacterium]|jgi:N-acetylglucosaminyldiphosphoundecaprenol N-acetyl-beta-D-mannosaminyltransferase|nr:WecB/TagA/CpsF family glycosyltransferase [Aggregatilineales bacterium]